MPNLDDFGRIDLLPENKKLYDFWKDASTEHTINTLMNAPMCAEPYSTNILMKRSNWSGTVVSGTESPNRSAATGSVATSYHQMFVEAARGSNLDVHTLREDWSYSFVLHHPLAAVVNPVNRPQLTLVRVYDIDATDHMITERRADDTVVRNEFYKTNVLTPKAYRLADMTEPAILAHHHAHTTATHISPGIMIMSSTGERTKHRNPAYEMVRHSCAAAKQVVADILCGKRMIHDTPVVHDLYRMYVDRYIRKTSSATPAPTTKSRPRRERTINYHLTQLQTLYFTELKPMGHKMNLERVAAYVDMVDGKTQIQTLDAVAWTVAREANRAKRAAERAAGEDLPPQPPATPSGIEL